MSNLLQLIKIKVHQRIISIVVIHYYSKQLYYFKIDKSTNYVVFHSNVFIVRSALIVYFYRCFQK